MTSLTYTANNRDGQTWLVTDNPYPEWIAFNIYESIINPDWKKFQADHPPILLNDYLPDGTKVRGDEIEVKWQYENPLTDAWTDSISNSKHINADTRQVATLKQKTEVVEDLLLGDGFSFHYEKGVIIIKDDKNETIEILFNNEVKELKSWINKIEL